MLKEGERKGGVNRQASCKRELVKRKRDNPSLTNLSELHHGGHDGVQSNFGVVSGVDVNGNTDKSALQGILGTRVKHLVSHRGGVRAPRNEHQLAGGTTIASVEFHIDQAVSALVSGQAVDHLIIGSFTLTERVDHNSTVFDSVDVVSVVVRSLLKLEFVELGDNVVRNTNTSGLPSTENTQRSDKKTARNKFRDEGPKISSSPP